MKKISFLATMILFALTNGYAQRVDTLYYDLDGKGVPNKDFADIVMMAYYGEDESMNRFRAFYTTGETYGKGSFVLIDKRDVNKSQLKDFELFYKSGKIMKAYEVNGIIEVRKEFYENGNIHRYDSLVNNKAEGLQYYEGSYDGKIIKCIEMKEGVPVNPFFTIWNDGVPCRYYIEDNSICNEEVTEFSVKEGKYSNGVKYYYYAVNGLLIRMASYSKKGDEKTKPSMFQLEVINKRNSNVEFAITNISARCTNNNNEKTPYFVFDDKPKKRISWEAANLFTIMYKMPDSWLKNKILEPNESLSGLFVLSSSKDWDFIDIKFDNTNYLFPISNQYNNSAIDNFIKE